MLRNYANLPDFTHPGGWSKKQNGVPPRSLQLFRFETSVGRFAHIFNLVSSLYSFLPPSALHHVQWVVDGRSELAAAKPKGFGDLLQLTASHSLRFKTFRHPHALTAPTTFPPKKKISGTAVEPQPDKAPIGN